MIYGSSTGRSREPIHLTETANIIWRAPSDFADRLLQLIGSKSHQEEISQLKAIGFSLTTGTYFQPRVKAKS